MRRSHGMPFALCCYYNRHNYGVALEVGTFVGRTADYLWIYVFGGLSYMVSLINTTGP